MAKALATKTQVILLIKYHQDIVDNCKIYGRYTELALEEMTILALNKLITSNACDAENQ
jgi:hypothetical protein